jgi:hypothetical protein
MDKLARDYIFREYARLERKMIGGKLLGEPIDTKFVQMMVVAANYMGFQYAHSYRLMYQADEHTYIPIIEEKKEE